MTTEQAQIIILLLKDIIRMLTCLMIGKFIKFAFFD